MSEFDDCVLPFVVPRLGVRGRVVQLGGLLDSLLGRHDYSDQLGGLIAESIALTSLLGTSLKLDGKFILQLQTDAIDFLVSEFRTPNSMRAYARVSEPESIRIGDNWVGEGNLVMTIDNEGNRYQGVVAVDNITLSAAAKRYFGQSEQILSEVILYSNKTEKGWRAGGLLVQFLPEGGSGEKTDIDCWEETLALTSTITEDELVGACDSPTLLYRLFGEQTQVFESVRLEDNCGCSEESVRAVLEGLAKDDGSDNTKKVSVTCEFCSRVYVFDGATAR